jgi:excisionase family DNA binding protein
MTTEKIKNQWIDTSIDPFLESKNKKETLYIIPKRKIMEDIEFLDSKQLMKLLKISEGTLHTLIKSNDIPHFYIGKKVLRFNKKSVMAWIQKLEDDEEFRV